LERAEQGQPAMVLLAGEAGVGNTLFIEFRSQGDRASGL
jgi:hypothetical protein